MRLEEVTLDNVIGLGDQELLNMRERANQLHTATENWRESIAKRAVGFKNPIKRGVLCNAFVTLTKEARRRSMTLRRTALDRLVLKRAIRGVDVGDFPPVLLAEAVVTLTGPFVRNSRTADLVLLYVADNVVPKEFEKRLTEFVSGLTGKDGRVTNDPDELLAPAMPLYDLMLVPRHGSLEIVDEEKLVKIRDRFSNTEIDPEAPTDEVDRHTTTIQLTDIAKPFANEHAARQLAPSGFRNQSRENNKFGSGIHAIWGITSRGKTKLQSIRFDANKFTPDQARKWLRQHDYKTTLEIATKKRSSFIKEEDQRLVGGIVYELNKVDSQGDYISDPADIWRAMETFAMQGMEIRFMHGDRPVLAQVVEQFQAEVDTVKGGDIIPSGAWYLCVKVEDDKLWSAIKAGEITGFSMAGIADTEDIGKG